MTMKWKGLTGGVEIVEPATLRPLGPLTVPAALGEQSALVDPTPQSEGVRLLPDVSVVEEVSREELEMARGGENSPPGNTRDITVSSMDWENEFDVKEERLVASGGEEQLSGDHERSRARHPLDTTPDDIKSKEMRDSHATSGFGGARDKTRKSVGATEDATAQTSRVDGERDNKKDSRKANSPRGEQGKKRCVVSSATSSNSNSNGPRGRLPLQPPRRDGSITVNSTWAGIWGKSTRNGRANKQSLPDARTWYVHGMNKVVIQSLL